MAWFCGQLGVRCVCHEQMELSKSWVEQGEESKFGWMGWDHVTKRPCLVGIDGK